MIGAAIEHNATQGDGNHFFYVGRVRSSGRVALVTHHGSRGPGGKLYAAGMTSAEKFPARQASPDSAHNAWIPSETPEGESLLGGVATDPRLDEGQPFRDPRP